MGVLVLEVLHTQTQMSIHLKDIRYISILLKEAGGEKHNLSSTVYIKALGSVIRVETKGLPHF